MIRQIISWYRQVYNHKKSHRSYREAIFLLVMVIFLILGFMTLAYAQSADKTAEIRRENVEYNADGLKDPFEGAFARKEEIAQAMPELPLPALAVQGVLWGGSLPQAIINNKIVKIGDTIEGAQVIDINKDGVRVLFVNREYNLLSPAASYRESEVR